MNEFVISSDGKYLYRNIQGIYHTNYTGYRNLGNPDYLNNLKNTFNNFEADKLNKSVQQLIDVLKIDLSKFDKNLTICIVPRSKTESMYSHNQLLFKKVVQYLIEELGFQDGSNYIIRHKNTKTTHLAHTPRGAQYAGDGDMPYPGITKNTCNISRDVEGRDILLIDDIYTSHVYIDEDAIQALLDNGANTVKFYAVGKTI